MQYRPDAAELLDAVASLLEDDVIAAVPAHLQHQVRVAANLCRILQREVVVGPANDAAERTRLVELLAAVHAGDAADASPDGDLESLRATLAARLDDVTPLDPDVERSLRRALLDTLRADLTIAKPGYATETAATQATQAAQVAGSS